MSKILSFIALPLAILIILKNFNIYNADSLVSFNVTLLGALFLVIMQVLSYMMVHSSNEGTTLMGKMIKTVLAVPGILYLISYVFPLNLGINLEIVIGLFLFTEAIYGLH